MVALLCCWGPVAVQYIMAGSEKQIESGRGWDSSILTQEHALSDLIAFLWAPPPKGSITSQ
jgi:hypothetical protein